MKAAAMPAAEVPATAMAASMPATAVPFASYGGNGCRCSQ